LYNPAVGGDGGFYQEKGIWHIDVSAPYAAMSGRGKVINLPISPAETYCKNCFINKMSVTFLLLIL
jgi:hypothetical protein